MVKLKGAIEEYEACIKDDEDGSGYLWDAVKSGKLDTMLQAAKDFQTIIQGVEQGDIKIQEQILVDNNHGGGKLIWRPANITSKYIVREL